MLTEIHRQAKDDPIIRMSMTVREGGSLAYGSQRSPVREVSVHETFEPLIVVTYE